MVVVLLVRSVCKVAEEHVENHRGALGLCGGHHVSRTTDGGEPESGGLAISLQETCFIATHLIIVIPRLPVLALIRIIPQVPDPGPRIPGIRVCIPGIRVCQGLSGPTSPKVLWHAGPRGRRIQASENAARQNFGVLIRLENTLAAAEEQVLCSRAVMLGRLRTDCPSCLFAHRL